MEALAEAAAVLSGGRPVAIPTDTVYGLAVDPFVPGAGEQLFRAKRRPREVHLPVLVDGIDQVLALAGDLPEGALALMERFWPGALTIVVPRRAGLAADLGADEATVGVRCPAHPVPRALCTRVGPLATTSANLHGQPTPVSAEEVAVLFGTAVPVVLDGGPCTGSPSTVVDCTGDEIRLLREGRIPFAQVLGFWNKNSAEG